MVKTENFYKLGPKICTPPPPPPPRFLESKTLATRGYDIRLGFTLNYYANPEIKNNTNSNESSIQFAGPERNSHDGEKEPR